MASFQLQGTSWRPSRLHPHVLANRYAVPPSIISLLPGHILLLLFLPA